MIPQEIVRFLEGATVAFGGTRNRNMKPDVHLATGWIVSPDRKSMTFLVPDPFAKRVKNDLEDNGQVAITITASTTGPRAGDPPKWDTDSHETYQFKGKFLHCRAVNDSDLKTFQDISKRAAQYLSSVRGMPLEIAQHFPPKPVLAFTFQVREIFDQTPGPGAGRRIAPAEES